MLSNALLPTSCDESPDKPRFEEISFLAVILGIACMGSVSLWTAQIGVHNGWVSAFAGSVAMGLFIWFLRKHFDRSALNLRALFPIVIILICTLALFLPGSFYIYGDKDPGVYVLHAYSIAETGDVLIQDAFAAEGVGLSGLTPTGSGFRFPGFWYANSGDASLINPQFFHFLPATLATAFDIGGWSLLLHFNAGIAALSVVGAFLVMKRVFGSRAAWIASAFLATNMIQVWQAKYPTTEILAQLFLFAAILAAVIAFDSKRPFYAGVSGFLISMIFLVRPDGFLLVIPALLVVALLYGLAKAERMPKWLAIGLTIPLPLAFYQAHFRNIRYSTSTEVPSLRLFLIVFLVSGIGALLLRKSKSLNHLLDKAQEKFWTASGPAKNLKVSSYVLISGLTIFFLARPLILGENFSYFGRTYDELNIYRLALFIPVPVLIAAFAGLIICIANWNWRHWILIVPGLLTLPVYLYQARVSPRLMWWTRRYAPTVVPLLICLAAVGLTWFMFHRKGNKNLHLTVGSVFIVATLILQLSQSLPLRDHREMEGAYSFGVDIQRQTEGVRPALLWEQPRKNDMHDASRNLSSVLWLVFERPGLVLNQEINNQLLADYATNYEDRTLYYLSRSKEIDPLIVENSLVYVGSIPGNLSFWEENWGSGLDAPSKENDRSYELHIWWVSGTTDPSTSHSADA